MVRVNYRLRLLIAVAALWGAGWGAEYYSASRVVNEHRTVAEILRRPDFETKYPAPAGPEAAARAAVQQEIVDRLILADTATSRRQRALTYGIGGLITLLLAAIAGRWFLRSFRPD